MRRDRSRIAQKEALDVVTAATALASEIASARGGDDKLRLMEVGVGACDVCFCVSNVYKGGVPKKCIVRLFKGFSRFERRCSNERFYCREPQNIPFNPFPAS